MWLKYDDALSQALSSLDADADLIFEASSGDTGNVLTIDGIRAMFQARAAVVNVEATYDGGLISLGVNCWKDSSGALPSTSCVLCPRTCHRRAVLGIKRLVALIWSPASACKRMLTCCNMNVLRAVFACRRTMLSDFTMSMMHMRQLVPLTPTAASCMFANRHIIEQSNSSTADAVTCQFQRHRAGKCRETGVLAYFDNNETQFEAVAERGQAAVLRALNAATLPDGSTATPAQAYTDVRRDASGQVVAARLAKWVRAGSSWW